MKDSLVNARQSKVAFEVRSEVVITGNNPEMADVTNPNGYTHGTVYFIVATYPSGLRFRHNWNYENPDKAEALRDRMEKTNFFNLRYWDSYRPVYGSQAYEANMPEELALEKKEEMS